ncbi:MAG: DUF1638 domain-containing protein [Planctomycetes bacterium]|nr:DUF1638 domain-containing protein [Planctomycetota bacterium]
MRLKVIACEVLRREVYHVAARARHAVDVTLLPQGLHDNSDTCRRTLQEEVDAAAPDRYDAVLLGYGLCNNAMAGVRADRLPLVIPRAHDCITLLVGSKERYQRLFAEAPGTYWFSSGWIECRQKRGEPIAPRPNSGLGPEYHADWNDLVAKYGEENARYLADFMSGWEAEYTRGVLIRFPFDRHLGLEGHVRGLCAEKGWAYAEVEGDLALLEAGLDAPDAGWDADRFLTVAPGQAVRASFDDGILSAEPASCGSGCHAKADGASDTADAPSTEATA